MLSKKGTSMRRIIRWIFLSFIFTVSTYTLAQTAPATPTPAPPNPPIDELTGTLKKIKDNGFIVIGHRDSSIPFSYLDDQKKPVGYSLDLCSKIVDAIKTELNSPNLEVRYAVVSSSTRIPMLISGEIDLECGSTTNNLTRQKQVSFAPITFITGTRLLIRKNRTVGLNPIYRFFRFFFPFKIGEIEELRNSTVAVAQGSTNERVLKAISDNKNLGIKLLGVKDHTEGLEAIDKGLADAYSTDDILLYGLVNKTKRPDDYSIVGRYLSYDPYSIMLRRDDAAFQLIVTRTLVNLFRSGEINQIYAKWFDPMGVPMSDLLKTMIQGQTLPE
jgi:glutamate/aspartate transport system substrate-binding protein